MGKKLSEMTLEELWQLFPIYLTEHQTRWKEWFSEEARVLKKALSSSERIRTIIISMKRASPVARAAPASSICGKISDRNRL